MFSLFFTENHSVHEIMWKNIIEPGRPQIIICRMRIACWITEAAVRTGLCVILTAFTQQ
jgi:hypothetical protein